MSISAFTNRSADPRAERFARLGAIAEKISESWPKYVAVVAAGSAASLLGGVLGFVTWPVVPLAILVVLLLAAAHADSAVRLHKAAGKIDKLEQRLVFEANSSRTLAGIRQLNSSDTRSPDARLASAARFATEYPAAVVFSLRSAHGVFAPTSWSYDGQLGQVRDEFEQIDGSTPGAIASRQGSAIVLSLSDGDGVVMPTWAEQAGFIHGIVTPITRGLDTTGIVYVLNKSTRLPTLAEIEQLELVVGFSSGFAAPVRIDRVDGFVSTGSKAQPFRVMESSSSVTKPAVPDIQMPGFSMDTGLERLDLNGTRLSLSPTEFSMMHTLASSPGRPVSPDHLMRTCWGPEARPADNAVDVAIFRLRRKLNKTATGRSLIKTVRGSGYMFVPPAMDDLSIVVAD